MILDEILRGVVDGLVFGVLVLGATLAAIAFWGLVFALGIWWARRRAA